MRKIVTEEEMLTAIERRVASLSIEDQAIVKEWAGEILATEIIFGENERELPAEFYEGRDGSLWNLAVFFAECLRFRIRKRVLGEIEPRMWNVTFDQSGDVSAFDNLTGPEVVQPPVKTFSKVTYHRTIDDHGTYQPPAGRTIPRPGKPSLRIIDGDDKP